MRTPGRLSDSVVSVLALLAVLVQAVPPSAKLASAEIWFDARASVADFQGRTTIATGTLGLYWGAVYLRRRSFVGPMVSHAGFNLIELLQYFTIGR